MQVSSTEQHVELLKTIFDFAAIKALLAREDFSVLYDSMHGVQGPYAKVRPLFNGLCSVGDVLPHVAIVFITVFTRNGH